MHLESWSLGKRARLSRGTMLALFIIGFAGTARGTEGLVPFTGEKSSWHGFDRYDFLMDEQTLEVTPASGKAKGVKGQRPCIVVVQKTVAAGNPWSWQACYWDHEPQTEVELLKRGFHIVFVAPEDASMPIIPHCGKKISPNFRRWPSTTCRSCTFAAARISWWTGTLASSRTRTIPWAA
jgi:hypothetical protein